MPILFHDGCSDIQTEKEEIDIISSPKAGEGETLHKTYSSFGTIDTSLGTTFLGMPQSMKPLRFSIALSGQKSPKWRGSGRALNAPLYMITLKNPIKGKLTYVDKGGIISQYFSENYQWYHDNAGTNGHDGLDIATFEGDDVMASASGKVVNARFTKYGGNSITIITPVGDSTYLATLYCHLNTIIAKEGDNVVAGQIIGKEGHTGEWCFGTHLHFALHLYSDPVPGTQQIGYPTGDSFTRLNYENGFKGALNPLFYFEESFMKYIIVGGEQFLLYEPLKLAFNIGDPEELNKLINNGLVGNPINVAELPTGYITYPLVDKNRLKDLFGIK